MSAFFSRAATDKLTATASPVTAPPFTIGAWLYPTVTQTQTAVTIAADGTNFWRIGLVAADWFISANSSGGVSNILIGAPVLNAWSFLIGRFIAAANRRGSVWEAGTITHGQNTGSESPSGTMVFTIGAFTSTEYWDGSIAEVWIANTDVQPDGGVLDNNLFHQLAFGGPFSVPHVACSIVEYRSLRSVIAGGMRDDETLSRVPNQFYTAQGAPRVDQHPPLPPWYAKPQDIIRNIPL